MPEKILDEIRTGLVTSEMPDARPYGFRVTWIKWDSGFRNTDLQITDRIIGIDGKLYEGLSRDDRSLVPGGYRESSYWANKGAKDGDRATLLIWRDGEKLEVTGNVRADRYYTTPSGRRALAGEGPETSTNDGFQRSWSGWLEDFEKRASNIFDGGWQRTLNIRQELKDALEESERVAYLVEHYPGPFAKTIKADFDRLIESLKGKKYDITPADLAYRSSGTRRVKEVIEAAQSARADFLKRNPAVTLDSLPPTDGLRGDRKAIAGKVVVLPPVRDIISEAGHGWYCVGGNGVTLVLVDMESKAMRAVLRAMYRYQQIVEPVIEETHEMIVRLTELPKLVATPRAAYIGILGELIADTVGEKMFVDTTGASEEPLFANEEKMHKPPVVNTREDQSPQEMMESFISALKLGDQDLWSSFFASWSCSPDDDGNFVYDPNGGERDHNMEYVHARKMIMSDVYDVRVAKVYQTRIYRENPKIEGVKVELDHIGLFDGEYRAYRNAELNRMWNLQRRDGGPWRITSRQGI